MYDFVSETKSTIPMEFPNFGISKGNDPFPSGFHFIVYGFSSEFVSLYVQKNKNTKANTKKLSEKPQKINLIL